MRCIYRCMCVIMFRRAGTQAHNTHNCSHCFYYYRNSRRRDGTMRALIPSERERYICSHQVSLIEDEHYTMHLIAPHALKPGASRITGRVA